jgi:lysophospholipase L1-like esterase
MAERRRVGMGLVALAFATLVSLGLCELFVRAFVTVRNVGPSFTVYDAEYGKRLRPGFSTVRIAPEFTMTLTTNSLGFRGPEPETPPRGVVLFLGDSFTMGYGVDDGQEFPALVRERLRAAPGGAIPVVNAGTGDTGNGRWVKFLRGPAAGFEPRAVVLQVHANDFVDNLNEALFALEPDGSLRELPPRPPGWSRRVQQVVESIPGLSYSRLVGLGKQLHVGGGNGAADGVAARPPAPDDPPSQNDRLTLRLVAEALRLCRAQGWPALLVLADVSDPQARWLREIAAEEGTPVLAIPPKTERPDLYFGLDGHWTAQGQAFAAGEILARLPELGVPVPDEARP